jgi:conjugative transfer region protein TrbK
MRGRVFNWPAIGRALVWLAAAGAVIAAVAFLAHRPVAAVRAGRAVLGACGPARPGLAVQLDRCVDLGAAAANDAACLAAWAENRRRFFDQTAKVR